MAVLSPRPPVVSSHNCVWPGYPDSPDAPIYLSSGHEVSSGPFIADPW